MKKTLSTAVASLLLGISSTALAAPCTPDAPCPTSPKATHQASQPQKNARQPQAADQGKQEKARKAEPAHQAQPSKAQPAKSQPAKAKGQQNQALHEERHIKVRSARLRSGPGTHYPVVRGLNKGDKVVVVKRSGDWAQVQVGTALFWISAALLSN